MSVLVVGSIALDNVKTPIEEHSDLLGGSTSYASVAASFFAPVNLVGIVGDDFPQAHIDFFKKHNIDLAGLQIVPGKTFRWSGEYMWDLNTRETRSIALNVFESFEPKLPAGYESTPYVLLGNIHPSLQHHVLDQVKNPRFVIADTMDLWINNTPEELKRLLTRIDMLILNDSEARMLTKQTSLIKAAAQIRNAGPAYLCIKKGEHGALLFGPERPVLQLRAPIRWKTSTTPPAPRDTFAGGLAGHLASLNHEKISFDSLRKAVVLGSVLASYNVEAFSLERLRTLTKADIDGRYQTFKRMSQFEVIG
ncbi:PfkB domain protein [Chthoniobacter flavus Ellin428]|uniref:PfkB domain protein n=1 Tax=Chthoniobacter flavus Ellin428 TaxID=497964 RepID=B4CYF3_9BACT|nr:PfkB family carbohydrate kinase [Chthoniobacter flavus]EDY20494.1 PfkB domain protein [Chthoniobacter flavus Ellin428]